MNTDNALRPRRFSEYIGQASLLDRLSVMVAAAKSRSEPLPHLLLSGPPGLGKTTLAFVIANEMGTTAHLTHGPALEKPQDVFAALAKLEAGDVLFIDEVHSLNRIAGEALYPALEDGIMSMPIPCGDYSRSVTVKLPPFTLVAATTQPGLLESPLRERFAPGMNLEFYSTADLSTILAANALKLGLSFEPAALQLLAARSRGTPRVANHLLKFARDYALARGNGTLATDAAGAALKMLGIDGIGLNGQDRQYLSVLRDVYGCGPVGAAAIAATMGLKPDTVAGVIEPYLILRGFVARTHRGRKLTEPAKAHLASIAA